MSHPADVPTPIGYLSRLLTLTTAMRIRPGEVAEIVVSHDAWCDVFTAGRRCTCHPDIVLRRRARTS